MLLHSHDVQMRKYVYVGSQFPVVSQYELQQYAPLSSDQNIPSAAPILDSSPLHILSDHCSSPNHITPIYTSPEHTLHNNSTPDHTTPHLSCPHTQTWKNFINICFVVSRTTSSVLNCFEHVVLNDYLLFFSFKGTNQCVFLFNVIVLNGQLFQQIMVIIYTNQHTFPHTHHP